MSATDENKQIADRLINEANRLQQGAEDLKEECRKMCDYEKSDYISLGICIGILIGGGLLWILQKNLTT